MLDFIATTMLVAAIIVSVNALTGAMPITPSQRIAVSLGAGLWTGQALLAITRTPLFALALRFVGSRSMKSVLTWALARA